MADFNVIPTGLEASDSPISFVSLPKFKFGKDSEGVITKVSGLPLLASRVLKVLFTRKGSNPLNLAEGSNFSELVGSFVESKADAAIVVTRAIIDVEDYFLGVQAKLNSFPASEMLDKIIIKSVVFETEASVKVSIIIRSVSGESALMLLRT